MPFNKSFDATSHRLGQTDHSLEIATESERRDNLVSLALSCFVLAPICLLAAILFRHVEWVVDLTGALFWVFGLLGIFLLGGYGLSSPSVRNRSRF